MDTSIDWPELLRHPGREDHMVQLYRDPEFLVEAVAQYLGSGLRLGEAALVIATPGHRKRFEQALARAGLANCPALRMMDAESTLSAFMVHGMPQWSAFQRACGNAIAELRLQYSTVRAYGEMVDLLWQRGERHAALRLEEFWRELGTLQSFSLLCAYCIDPLDVKSYGGSIQDVCKAHTHLIPARDYARFNAAVTEAAKQILDQPLAQMLLSLSANHRPHTDMPLGQAALLWLRHNMPRTAERILNDVPD